MCSPPSFSGENSAFWICSASFLSYFLCCNIQCSLKGWELQDYEQCLSPSHQPAPGLRSAWVMCWEGQQPEPRPAYKWTESGSLPSIVPARLLRTITSVICICINPGLLCSDSAHWPQCTPYHNVWSACVELQQSSTQVESYWTVLNI